MGIKINAYHGTYNRGKRSAGLGSIKYFVVHYTGTSACAKNNCIFFSGGNRGASADYFIDKDGSIWEYNDITGGYYSWHCGDGKGRYGITNSNSIGVEVVSAGEDFTSAQIAAIAALYAYICGKLGRRLEVVRHYDASRKSCPAPYVNSTKWAKLKAEITGGKVEAATAPTPKPTSKPSQSTASKPATGKVADFQSWLNTNYKTGLAVDNSFGPASKKGAVKALQTELNRQCGKNLSVDGSFGPKTKAACINVRQGAKGNITRIIQGCLYGRGYNPNGLDGSFGPGCKSAVIAFQKANGLSPDGVVGPNTFAKLLS